MLADVALARVKDRSTSINKSASACCDILKAPVSAYNHIYHLAEQLHTVLLCGEDFQCMIALRASHTSNAYKRTACQNISSNVLSKHASVTFGRLLLCA